MIIKKYNKILTNCLILFIIYFIIGSVFSYYFGTANYYNVLFDIDSPRVLEDLSLLIANHYRSSVHPLFVIIFQPVTMLINLFIKDRVLAILILQSLIGSINVIVFTKVLNSFNCKKYNSTFLTIIFAFSFGQIVFTSNIETYIFAQLFVIATWIFFSYKKDKKLNFFSYLLLILLGVGCIAVTITNFFQYLIILFFFLMFNKNENNKILKFFWIVFCVLCISVFLATVQNLIWDSAPNFFVKNISDFLNNTSEETLYVDYSITFSKIINVINSNFSYSFYFFKLYKPASDIYLVFQNSVITDIISSIMFLIFLAFNIYYIIKTKFCVKKDSIYYAMLTSYFFNFLLHLFYGNNISFLYICHYNFLIPLIIGYLVTKLGISIEKYWRQIIAIIFIYLISMVYQLSHMFNIFKNIYNKLEYIRLLPFIIIGLLIIILIWILLQRVKHKIILTIVVILITIGSYLFVNSPNKYDSTDIYFQYLKKLELYTRQLKDMKNQYMVGTYEDVKEPINIYFFGMANRRKMLYKNGSLIDIKTNKELFKFDYEEELIIPNEYAVILKNKENSICIKETINGVYIEKNGQQKIIEGTESLINLPEFDSSKYSEILKVLHQEILFNIDGDTPKPNIFFYESAWYRDAMLETMVLEKTNNVFLLNNWIKSINSIYDFSRDKSIAEIDNLGELLYIIGASKIDRNDLIQKIIKEIEKIKTSEKNIKGNIDGYEQAFYPTSLALFGARKNNIELDLVLPNYDDGYARLTWYTSMPIATNQQVTSRYYPYINWAFYHYSNYGKLYVLDEIYPLTYEGGEENATGKIESECFISEYYCEKNVILSHSWHASEMFLFLIEQ